MPDEVILWGGMVYRRDILDTMTGGYVAFPSGNDEPSTVADWEYMLPLMKAYFEAAGFKDYAPLILPSAGYFTTGEMENGFGASGDFYVVNGEVKYGLDKAHGSAENELYQRLGIADGSYCFDENGQFHWHPLVDDTAEAPLTRIGINGLRLPGLCMVEYANASNADFTLAANDQWTRYGTGNNYPSSAYATADESATLTQNSTTYTDYVNVMVPKFITGTEELTRATFQKFVDRLMSLGVEENLQLRQEIYDRHIGK